MMYLLDDTPGRECIIDNKEFLFFSGYSYLGMNHVKKFRKLVKEGVDKYGVLFPSSRISNTRFKLYEKFESALSALTRQQETVSFSSGFLAGKTISSVLSQHKNMFVAPGTHPAIDLPINEKDFLNFNDWQTSILQTINNSHENEFLLAADSVNILSAEVNDFSFLKNINPGKKITFLIDDSHGIGILGRNGEGITRLLPKKENIESIICYSLSKAYNIEGGAVSCSNYWAAKLRQHPNYTGSTAINPSLIYAFLKSENLYAKQRDKLLKNIAFIKKRHPSHIRSHNYPLPIFMCDNPEGEKDFYEKGMIISSFGYPDPTSKKINRVVINALHTKKDLKKLCAAFE